MIQKSIDAQPSQVAGVINSLLAAVRISNKLFSAKIGPAPISRREITALDHNFADGVDGRCGAAVIDQADLRSLDGVAHRVLAFLDRARRVEIHSPHGAGFGGAEANHQNAMGGKMTLIFFELSRRHPIRSQLNDAQTRKKFLTGEGLDELMKQHRHRKKYRDFLPNEPLGDL